MKSKLSGRYSAAGSAEGEFEPGSHKLVLKNLLHITRKRDLDNIETIAYDNITIKALTLFGKHHRFTEKDICKIHKLWLNKIYVWAGEYRNVNISKGGFQFASAHLLPKLMQDFEKNTLSQYTPCNYFDIDEIAEAIAIVHTEFILIHPFREGNGRLGRLFSVLMALQADLPVLNFELVKGKRKQDYICAIQAGLSRNYEPMKKLFKLIINKTIKTYGEKR